MRTRPALVLAELLALLLVLLAPDTVAIVANSVLGALAWAVTQPLLVSAALVVTLVWCALVPDGSGRRWARWT